MRRPARRIPLRRVRRELEATAIPIWTGPRPIAANADDLTFSPAPGWLPSGRRIYALGDIHGALSALRALHRLVRADLAARPIGSATLIYLGDLIDYGEDSAGVLDLIATMPSTPGLAAVSLRGDHEQMLLDALDGEAAAATDWLHEGGEASLRSWGVASSTPRENWPALLPAAHVAFLRGLADSYVEGGYLFAHAGIRPGVPLARQRAEDLLGIRQPFLSAEQDFGAVVIHGHSVVAHPTVRSNRIALDTGAGLGGYLTCAVLEADRIGFIASARAAHSQGTSS
jgi:serine/threonine protein phosphatase 1